MRTRGNKNIYINSQRALGKLQWNNRHNQLFKQEYPWYETPKAERRRVRQRIADETLMELLEALL